MKVSEYMSREVKVCSPQNTLRHASRGSAALSGVARPGAPHAPA